MIFKNVLAVYFYRHFKFAEFSAFNNYAQEILLNNIFIVNWNILCLWMLGICQDGSLFQLFLLFDLWSCVIYHSWICFLFVFFYYVGGIHYTFNVSKWAFLFFICQINGESVKEIFGCTLLNIKCRIPSLYLWGILFIPYCLPNPILFCSWGSPTLQDRIFRGSGNFSGMGRKVCFH